MSSYPYKSESGHLLKVPAHTAGLQLRAWQLVLQPDESCQFPSGTETGFLAITWKGAVCLDPSDDHPCDPDDSGWTAGPITSGSVLQATSSGAAVVLVIGIVGDSVPEFDGRLHPRGKTVLAFADAPSGEVTAFVTLLDLNQRGEPVPADWWPRPCFVLTSVDGPTPIVHSVAPAASPTTSSVARQSIADDDLDIYLVKVPGGTWLGFQDGTEGKNETIAVVCDFRADGDPSDPGVLGCSWRCHGSV